MGPLMKHLSPLPSAAAFLLLAASAAHAQLDPVSGVVTGTNVTHATGATVASLNGVNVINHGLVGVGRIPASALDKWGESLGSVSGLQITDWARTGPHRYAGSLHILPDR